MAFAGISDKGQRRARNEDAFLTDGEAGLFIVADGIGGLADGAVASRVAVDETLGALRGSLHESPPDPAQRAQALAAALIAANRALWRLKGGRAGATCLVAKITSTILCFAHAGDCKLYLYRDRELSQINREHSLVRRLVDEGALSEKEALSSSYRNVVERALGTDEALEPEFGTLALERGDRVLLTSDGLLADLSVSDVAAILGGFTDPERCCEELIAAANAAGGSDNITVVVVDIRDNE